MKKDYMSTPFPTMCLIPKEYWDSDLEIGLKDSYVQEL